MTGLLSQSPHRHLPVHSIGIIPQFESHLVA